MADVILVLNAGSSSIKFRAFGVQGQALDLVLRGQIDGLSTSPRFVAVDSAGNKTTEDWGAGAQLDHQRAIEHIGAFLRGHGEGHRLMAVGHRVVHGGQTYSGPVRITPAVLEELQKLIPLAPLHQPHNLSPIPVIARIHPDMPQVACFDTAFHRSAPEVAQAYALPSFITEKGVRRYGFHGLSYEYIASVLPRIAPAAATGRTVVAHLGNGASMCAIVGGRSVASTTSVWPDSTTPPFVSPSCAGIVANRFAHLPPLPCVSVASTPAARSSSRTVSIRPRFGLRLTVSIDTRRVTQGSDTGDSEEAGEADDCDECAVSAT
jgi:acetate kinase